MLRPAKVSEHISLLRLVAPKATRENAADHRPAKHGTGPSAAVITLNAKGRAVDALTLFYASISCSDPKR